MTATVPYILGAHQVGEGVLAYLYPDGSWGRNNAGMVIGEGESLLVDTLFDPPRTRTMLEAYQEAAPGAGPIRTLVITHGNGDHHYGSEVLPGAEIVTTKAAALEMEETPPEMLAGLVKLAPDLGELGAYFLKCFGEFDFEGVTPRKPTRLFEGELTLTVGGREVILTDLGPAHTASDVAVLVPDAGVLFAGDLLFIGGTPILWKGPVENWISALDRILDLPASVIVPGHGPLTDRAGVQEMKHYWEFLAEELRKLWESGVSEDDAIRKLYKKPFSGWTDPERVVINVHTLYGEFSGTAPPEDVASLFTRMAALAGKD